MLTFPITMFSQTETPNIVFCGRIGDSVGRTAYSHSVSLTNAPASSDRYLIVMVAGYRGLPFSISSVSINSVATTEVFDTGNTNNWATNFYIVYAPTGSSVDVSVNYNASTQNGAGSNCTVWAVYMPQAPTVHYVKTNGASSSPPPAITIPSSSGQPFSIAAQSITRASQPASTSATLGGTANLTEDLEQVSSTFTKSIIGSVNKVGGTAAGETVTSSFSGGSPSDPIIKVLAVK